MGFNSTLVRLKCRRLQEDRRPARPFQFHAGSIKAAYAAYAYARDAEFQFHAGSIKGRPRGRLRRANLGFNSTLVRLKCGRGAYQVDVYRVSIPRWFD